MQNIFIFGKLVSLEWAFR